MTRVLIISQLPPPFHGSTVITRTLSDGLVDAGVEVAVVERRFSRAVGEVGRFSLRKLGSALAMPFRLWRELRRFRPDVVVFFITNRSFSFLVDVVLGEVLRAMQVRTVHYIHTTGYSALAERGRMWAGAVRRLFGSASCVVTLGPALVADVSSWIERPVVIPNAVPDPATTFRDGAGQSDQESRPLVLFFSNLIAEKGADAFLRLAAHLSATMEPPQFVVAGSAPSDTERYRLEDLATSLGLEGSALFSGAVTDQYAKWQMLRDADLLVFPSTYPYEAQPLTIIEAFATSTAVVAYDTGGIRDLISADAGALVPVGDEAALAARVVELLSDRSRLERAGQGARRRYESAHSIRAYTQAWLHVFESVTGTPIIKGSDHGA